MSITLATHVRPALATEHAVLMTVWERSVRATHDFLTEADVLFYRPLVAEYFASASSALWVEPAHRGKGGGRLLVSHAQSLMPGALTVDVNEQNLQACGFYEALGFAVVGRSPVDDYGRPFPLLHMRREA